MCRPNTANKKITNQVVLKRHIITTADGSKTIQIEEWNEQYHSIHGAIQEAKHVFIKHGFQFCIQNFTLSKTDLSAAERSKDLAILEVGLGTGLNAFLTLLEAESFKHHINYTGIEAYPVLSEEICQLNYVEQLGAEKWRLAFEAIHYSPWEQKMAITPRFQFTKSQTDFNDIEANNDFDLIYFDAFGPRVQPELWTENLFAKMYKALKPNGILVTYSAKGSVRRAMQSVGFLVEKLPGPPGKREMLRAIKGF